MYSAPYPLATEEYGAGMIRLQMEDISLRGNVFMSTTQYITVCAINAHNTPQSFENDIPLKVKLLYAENLQPVDDRVLVFAEDSELAIKKETSRCMLNFTSVFTCFIPPLDCYDILLKSCLPVRFSESCVSHENKHFVLSASALDSRSVRIYTRGIN